MDKYRLMAILRLRKEQGKTIDETATELHITTATVVNYTRKLRELGLWESKRKNYKLWTLEDIKNLKLFLSKGLTLSEIARKLDRNYVSVVNKKNLLHLCGHSSKSEISQLAARRALKKLKIQILKEASKCTSACDFIVLFKEKRVGVNAKVGYSMVATGSNLLRMLQREKTVAFFWVVPSKKKVRYYWLPVLELIPDE